MVSFAPIDGMPLIWIAKLYGRKISCDRRLTYVDFLPPLLDIAQRKRWRLYYLGSRPEVCARGFQVLSSQFPHIELQAAHGYFDVTTDGVENQRVLQEIDAFQPDILMVGMGMPRQEEWIATNRTSLRASVILPCGAAIDYLAGAIPTPPRWAGRIGLEWLFRLCAEPRRLAHRYLIEPWFLLSFLIADLTRRS
jgi:N-acetylglucosaminyldiphosphoundecaprenol N-acetyl-beta-D-mannosaminyltransferase